MIITKMLALGLTEMKFNDESGGFKGYASVFGGIDSQQDTILKGAYLPTLKEHGMPKMFYNHKYNMPIGKYLTVDEDSKGLWVEGELTTGHSLASDVRAAMKHETIDGLSIGGGLARGDFTPTEKGGRVIHKWTLLREISPVVFPADGNARIDPASVKSIDFETLLPECKTERDIERLLRDAGLGKWEAMALVSRAKSIFSGRDAPEDAEAKAVAILASRFKALENIGA